MFGFILPFLFVGGLGLQGDCSSGQPSVQQVSDAILRSQSAVHALDNFYESGLDIDGSSPSQKAQDSLPQITDQLNQLEVLRCIAGLGDDQMIEDIISLTESMQRHLQDMVQAEQGDFEVVLSEFASARSIWCCSAILPDLSKVWQDSADDNGISGVGSMRQASHACEDQFCPYSNPVAAEREDKWLR